MTDSPLIGTKEAEEQVSLGIVIDLRAAIRDAEARIIRVALGQTGGNVSGTARLLKINRPTLHQKMKRYQI